MDPNRFLRVEGVAAFVGGVGAFLALDGPIWLLALLALAPDLSMLAYLAGPRVGALGYNLAHTYTLPVALGGAGLWAGPETAVLVAAVWVAHIGADRAIGYGLKYESGFRDTHLSVQPAPAAALVESD
jgi:hypothetical protein